MEQDTAGVEAASSAWVLANSAGAHGFVKRWQCCAVTRFLTSSCTPCLPPALVKELGEDEEEQPAELGRREPAAGGRGEGGVRCKRHSWRLQKSRHAPQLADCGQGPVPGVESTFACSSTDMFPARCVPTLSFHLPPPNPSVLSWVQAKRAAWDQWAATVSWPRLTLQATKVRMARFP